MTIRKQGKLEWPSNDGKITSLSSFALSSTERPSIKARGFKFQFGMVWENWLTWLAVWLKIFRCKTKNGRLGA